MGGSVVNMNADERAELQEQFIAVSNIFISCALVCEGNMELFTGELFSALIICVFVLLWSLVFLTKNLLLWVVFHSVTTRGGVCE